MNRPDRLGDLAHRQLDNPMRDLVFVTAMIAMVILSLAAVTGAASSLLAGGPATDQTCETQVVRPVYRG